MRDFERAYEQVFTPGAPVASSRLLYGRDGDLKKLERYLSRPGLHPIVIGSRGVGKTSLVVHALAGMDHAIIGCDADMDFNQIAHALLREAGIADRTTERTTEIEKEVSGGLEVPLTVKAGAAGRERKVRKERGVDDLRLTPWEVFERVREHGRKIILVLDEYDLVPHENLELHRTIAKVVKNLADNSRSCDSRVVIVGIARTAQGLLGRHPSIERSLRELFLRPLTEGDIYDFLTAAEQRLKFKFAPRVKQVMIDESNGNPYFVHLVGLECLDVMVEGRPKTRVVTEEHYEEAIGRAVQAAFRSQLQKWSDAVRTMDPHEETLVRELVAGRDHHPLRTQLQARLVRGGAMDEKTFSHALLRLQQEKRLLYLSRGKDQVRFVDPLMRPFLRILLLPAPFSRKRRNRRGRASTKQAQMEQIRLPLPSNDESRAESGE